MQTASWGEPDDFEVLMAVQTTIDRVRNAKNRYPPINYLTIVIIIIIIIVTEQTAQLICVRLSVT